jgi:3-dehydroquinate synthetase
LPKRELRQGWSEIFKYALLDSHLLIDLMQKYFDEPSNLVMTRIIEETIRIRMKIRKVDPLASNLGHTFGHAFEKISNYRISHGDAISIGTLMAIQFGEKKGVTRIGLHDEILSIMNNLELNTKFHKDFTFEEVAKIMLKDKKSSSKEINLVLISDIARPFYNKKDLFYSVRADEMTDYLSEYALKFSDRLDNKLYENL